MKRISIEFDVFKKKILVILNIKKKNPNITFLEANILAYIGIRYWIISSY